MRFPLSIVLLCISATLHSQLIWTDPVFPTPSQPVTVYFDATQGTGGLANCNCDVYVHTGLITSESTSPSDWKHVVTTWGVANAAWKMTPVPGQPNQYSYDIAPSILEYYGVSNPNETIEKLAFVFRNADGSKEGKDVGGADIFYPVYPDAAEFHVTLTSPSETLIFATPGQVIPVQGEATEDATLSLFDNGNLIFSTFGKTLNYNINVSGSGTHEILFLGERNDTAVDSRSFTYLVPNDPVIADLPAGAEPGITYLGDTAAIFALYAPGKENVFLIGDFNDWKVHTDYQLNLTPDGSTWWIQIGGLTPGQYYAFQYLVDGSSRIGGPYSELILDPANDSWIPEQTWPNLPPYPTGKTTGIVSLMQPGKAAYNWQVTDFQRPAKEKLVIYELLLRDWVGEHDFQHLTERLDYLAELGINAIELMPVSEFDGNISWGYNPTYHYALDKYYGTPDAFKALVDACHERGIAVILDVVFNHAHEKNPLAMLYWNDAAYKPAPDNPWLNEDPTHDFNVFYDFNHESPATKFYVKKTLQHWLDEYHVDGFRFDLSKGFTQNVNGPWHAGNYDASRIAILKDYMDAVWETAPGAYNILEHFTDWNEEKELVEYGALVWGGFGIHNEYLEAAMGYSSDLSGASYKSRGWTVPGVLAYMESHDEERMMYKNLQFGNGGLNYSVKDLPTALDRVELANTFFYTIPGPKMLWQFGELGYDYSINTCTNGTVSNDCRLDPKPIRWDYAYQPDRVNVYNNARKLLWLRNNVDLLHTTDFDLNVNGFQKYIYLHADTMEAVVMGNFGIGNATLTADFPENGWYYEYFSGDSLEVNGTTSLDFGPGEFRLYFSKKLEAPTVYTADEEVEETATRLEIFPNPATGGQFFLRVMLPQATEGKATVYDIAGRRRAVLFEEKLPAGETNLTVNHVLEPGIYFIHFQSPSGKIVKKLLVR